MSPFAAEVIGTFLLILLGNGVCAATSLNKSFAQNGGWVVISMGWGLAVFAGVTVAGPYSGAHINPAVTVGLAAAGKFPWADVPVYIVGQFIGAMLGALLVWLNYSAHYRETPGSAVKRGSFCTSPAINRPALNLLNEMVGTFVLVLVVLSFTDPTLASEQLGDVSMGLGSIGALPVALLVISIGLSLGGTTGYAINPARDLGPRIVYSLLPIADKDAQWHYAWIPVLGPLAGAVIAAGLHLGLAWGA
jgi:glycerol uptake facilitator protein